MCCFGRYNSTFQHPKLRWDKQFLLVLGPCVFAWTQAQHHLTFSRLHLTELAEARSITLLCSKQVLEGNIVPMLILTCNT